MGVTPRLSGRSSPGGGSSLGEIASALGGPGGTVPFSGGASSTPSSGAGVVVSLVNLRVNQNKSAMIITMTRTPIPSPTASP